MTSIRKVLLLSCATLAISGPIGCSGNDADKTGLADGGIGAPGQNAPDIPQSPEEARKLQEQEEAAFQKSRKK